MNVPPLLLSPEQRPIVEQTLRDLCCKRQWTLHEVNVRSNHIHIVVTAVETKPEKVMSDLKAKATWMLRKMKIIAQDQKPWMEHGSTRYLFSQEEFEYACNYVRDCQ
jgi:REP element-mobilizing transposase RayT